MRGATLTRVLLAAVAVLLLLNLVAGDARLPESVAAAQPAGDLSPFNATEQRKRMIDALDEISGRLAKLESKLDKGLNVKVTEMPAVKVMEKGTE